MRKVVLRYLIKTILSYLAVILLVIVLLFPIYKTAYETTETVIKSDITYDIRQRLNNLSDELESIELYVESIKSETSLITLAYLPDTNHSHLISARELQKSLRDTMFSLSVLVDDVIIFCGQSDYVITQAGTELRDEYYGSTIRYDNLTREQYEELLLAGKQTLLPIQNVYTRNLGFEQPTLTVNYFSDTTTQAFYSFSFLIKESTLTKRLITPLISQYGSLQITNESGNLLYTYGEGQISNDAQQIEISDDSGSYHAALTIDNAAFSESIRSVQQTIATYVIIAVLVCSIFCGIMIIRMVRPLKEYIAFVDRYYDGDDLAAYSKTLQDCLQQSMQGMIVRGDMLEKQLKNIQERYLHSILSNAAAGVRVNQRELADCLAEEKIFKSPYLVARMYLDPGENAQSVRQREEWIEMVRQHLLAATEHDADAA